MGLFGSREEAPRARSTEEREAARRAREAQRAARRGEPPPDFGEPAPPAPAPAPRSESPRAESVPSQRREEPTAAPRSEEPVVPPREEPVARPREEPVARPREEPVAPPREEPVAPPREEPVARPREEPVVPPREEPVVPPREEPVVPPREEPVVPPREEPVARPREEPVVPPREEPIVPPREEPFPAPRREAPVRSAEPVPEPVGRYAGTPSPAAPVHEDVAQSTAAWDVAQEDDREAWNEQDMQAWEDHDDGRNDARDPWDPPPAATTTHDVNGNGASAHPPAIGGPADDLGHHDELGYHDELGHDDDLAWHDEAATGEFAAQGYVQQHAPAPEPQPAPDPVTSSPEPEPEQEPARGRFSRRPPRAPGPPPLPARRAAGVGRATKRNGGHAATTGTPPATASATSSAAPAAAAAAPPPRRGRRPLALALFLAPVIAVVWFLAALFQPLGGDGEGTVAVTIPEGASVGEIGDILADEGVVDSGLFFRARATLSGDGAALRSGPHDLRQGMSYSSAITAISTPPTDAGPTDVVDVVIPEGLSRGEIAPIVEEAGIEGDYEDASESFEGFSPRGDFDAPEGTDTLEGFLFPATYELAADADAEDLVADQLEAFQENFAEVDLTKAEEGNLTPYEVLVVASMVERETSVPEERRLVAAVIYNRLSDGMPLGIDATIRYANDNWDSPLKQSELQEDGPYNTRTRTGLPPTPIGNPGLASIEAAANPADEDFLYYVVKPGTCGEHNFSNSDAQFQQDAAEYNRARDAAGGNSPTTC
ncbi:MAG: endolytic transglycosylase MltG [Solirubrobacteraceae bacterium MAG38_C4-C5]|nr:endolytic transglycosylase MltG [Candidatus Siliceabacter maunaloa]